MKKKQVALTAIMMFSAVYSVFAYKMYRAAGNLYIYTTTPASPVFTVFTRIACHTLNQNLGTCTYQVQKYSFNGTNYVAYNLAGYTAVSE